MRLQIVCKKCGKVQDPEKEKSNGNWSIFTMKCKCGGDVKFEVKPNQ